ncbi:signal peptidase I [Candidatus Bathyarchaeota archaeon]|nr:signal peptidase I [Candidatus Bathyarchaeota archaeon]
MIIRGTMPIMQMAPFIGLNGAIVGGLFYLGIDAISSFGGGPAEPKLVMVRDQQGQVLSIKTEGGSQAEPFTLFDEEPETVDEVIIEKPLSEYLGLTYDQIVETIKTVLLIALILETYMGAAYISNNFTPLMVVTTGSMEPTIKPGDLIYVKGVPADEIQVNDIITFKPPRDYVRGTLITHRVIDIQYDSNEIYYKTKGDNNPSVDPWTVTSKDLVGRQTAVLPNVGSFFLWIKTPAGLATMATVLVVYLFWPNIKQALGGKLQ